MSKRVTLTYDGERLTIYPVALSATENILSGFEAGEMFPTLGVETLAVTPAEPDELIGAFGVSLDYESALRFLKTDTLLRLMFPAGEGRREIICISEN